MHGDGINTNAGGQKLLKPSIISPVHHEVDEPSPGLLHSKYCEPDKWMKPVTDGGK
jgi:hypothetical protein